MSLISVRQTMTYLEVLTDGQTCFRSEKTRLPSGNHFGISGSSAEKPDSFELLSFLVIPGPDIVPTGNKNGQSHDIHPTLTDPLHPYIGHIEEHLANQYGQQGGHPGGFGHPGDHPGGFGHPGDQHPFHDPNYHNMFPHQQMMADEAASHFHTQSEQFADLHDRIQGIQHMINTFYDEMTKFAQAVESHQKELITVLTTHLADKDTLDKIGRQTAAIETIVQGVKADVHDVDLKFKLDNVHETVMQHHRSLMYELPEHMHGSKLFLPTTSIPL
jgi:mannose-binding lectin 1